MVFHFKLYSWPELQTPLLEKRRYNLRLALTNNLIFLEHYDGQGLAQTGCNSINIKIGVTCNGAGIMMRF